MSDSIKVRKRNGRGIEPLNLEKMHKMVEEATTGLAGVSASQVEINSGIQFYDGITTDEIQSILIRSASDLITLDNPNYQFVAARLLLFGLRKNLYRRIREMPPLIDHINKCVDNGVYDKEILDNYFPRKFDFRKINDKMLNDVNYKVKSLNYNIPIPLPRKKIESKMEYLIKKQIEQYSYWGWKDPRTCLTLAISFDVQIAILQPASLSALSVSITPG